MIDTNELLVLRKDDFQFDKEFLGKIFTQNKMKKKNMVFEKPQKRQN